MIINQLSIIHLMALTGIHLIKNPRQTYDFPLKLISVMELRDDSHKA
jgi:hypothetical protein